MKSFLATPFLPILFAVKANGAPRGTRLLSIGQGLAPQAGQDFFFLRPRPISLANFFRVAE